MKNVNNILCNTRSQRPSLCSFQNRLFSRNSQKQPERFSLLNHDAQNVEIQDIAFPESTKHIKYTFFL